MKEMTFKIVVVGEPGVGKSTFIVGAYVHANRGATSDSLVATDHSSSALIQSVVSDYVKNGCLPATEPDCFTRFDFEYLPEGKKIKSAPAFSWLDYSGEYFALLRNGGGLSREERDRQRAQTADSDACCVMVDGDALFRADDTFADHLARLRECLHFIHDTRRPSRYPYPVALVFTKSDKVPPEGRELAHLETKAGKLRHYLSSNVFVSQSFLSSVRATRPDPQDSFRIEVEHTADATFWLMRQLLAIHHRTLGHPCLPKLAGN